MEFTLGSRIRAARTLAGFSSPEALSDELKRRGVPKVGRTLLYALEADREFPKSVPVLREIAEACNLPLAWFTVDFGRLEEISEDPRTRLAQEIAAAAERFREQQEGSDEDSLPLLAEGQEH